MSDDDGQNIVAGRIRRQMMVKTPDVLSYHPSLGDVYRIPWRCDQLARVTRLECAGNPVTHIGLVWLDDAWRRTEPGIWCSLAAFLEMKPMLMEEPEDG